MRSVEEQFIVTSRGGILYDASRGVKPDDRLFEPRAATRATAERRAGRGSIWFVQAGDAQGVLRHYRRGGWMAKVLHDQYLWIGAHRTRSFAEWRLLAQLQRLGLPAPAPIAARYVRRGLVYQADLITELVPDARTLAEAMCEGSLSENVCCCVGATVAAFHRAGVHHADLNAHNVLLRRNAHASPVYVLDFDRGCIRARGAWEQRVLSRLRRSLEKIKVQRPEASFSEREWRWLMSGYERS